MREIQSIFPLVIILLTLITSSLVEIVCVEIVWRKLTLVTLGLRRVACVAGVERDIGVGREGKGPYTLQHFCPSRPPLPSPPIYVPTKQAT